MSKQEKEPVFSAKNLKLLTAPLGRNNPITVQVLGICSALAVTVKLKPAIVMAISVTIVVAVSNVVIAAMRKSIPDRIRIIVQLVVIATMVILVDQFLKAYAFDVSKQLSVFVIYRWLRQWSRLWNNTDNSCLFQRVAWIRNDLWLSGNIKGWNLCYWL